jgi:hypothetical protein
MNAPRFFFVLFVIASMFLLPTAEGAGSSVSGVITYRVSGCDYFLVQTQKGYDLLEWYGGHDPDKGDVLVGRYEEYGFHDVLDDTADEPLRIYVEDFWLTKSDALEHLADKCE